MDPASIKQMAALLDGVDASLKRSFENMHHGHLENNLERFLKAREGNVTKANKMLLDCLNWRRDNDIDNILSRPILPKESYDAIRDSQLIGMTGFCNQGRPVFAVGVGFSNFDKAVVDKYVQSHIQINEYRDRVVLPEASDRLGKYVGSCLKILDMTGLKFSALSRIKILTAISTIDDLNYPEKTDTYYIVNAPLGFNACWKAVRPLLQERTKRKIKVLPGSGREELLKVMDASVIPDFCRSSKDSARQKTNPIEPSVSCFSPAHPFHVELWKFMNEQAQATKSLMPTLSYHVNFPEGLQENSEVVHVIESTLEHLTMDENGNDLSEQCPSDGDGSSQHPALSSDGSSHHGTDDEASSSNNAK